MVYRFVECLTWRQIKVGQRKGKVCQRATKILPHSEVGEGRGEFIKGVVDITSQGEMCERGRGERRAHEAVEFPHKGEVGDGRWKFL